MLKLAATNLFKETQYLFPQLCPLTIPHNLLHLKRKNMPENPPTPFQDFLTNNNSLSTVHGTRKTSMEVAGDGNRPCHTHLLSSALSLLCERGLNCSFGSDITVDGKGGQKTIVLETIQQPKPRVPWIIRFLFLLETVDSLFPPTTFLSLTCFVNPGSSIRFT